MRKEGIYYHDGKEVKLIGYELLAENPMKLLR